MNDNKLNLKTKSEICIEIIKPIQTPNTMLLSILSFVWPWLRPILPEPFTYIQQSRNPYTLIYEINIELRVYNQIIIDYMERIRREQDEMDMDNTYNIEYYKEWIKKIENEIVIATNERDNLKNVKNILKNLLKILLVCCKEIQNNMLEVQHI